MNDKIARKQSQRAKANDETNFNPKDESESSIHSCSCYE